MVWISPKALFWLAELPLTKGAVAERGPAMVPQTVFASPWVTDASAAPELPEVSLTPNTAQYKPLVLPNVAVNALLTPVKLRLALFCWNWEMEPRSTITSTDDPALPKAEIGRAH